MCFRNLQKAHYSEKIYSTVWGLSWNHLKGPSLTGLMADPGCQQRPQLGLPRTLTYWHHSTWLWVIFFLTSRFRILMVPQELHMNACRKRNRSTSFLRPGMGNCRVWLPLSIASSLGARFKRGQDRTQTPHLSRKSVKILRF